MTGTIWQIVSKDKQGNEIVIMNVTTKQKADEELKRCKQLLSSDNQYRIKQSKA